MAKQTQRINCLIAWLRDRKPFTGLNKPKKDNEDEKINVNIYGQR